MKFMLAFSSLTLKENWSQVALAILAKNQLATDGRTSVKLVVMPALNHWDSTLTQDRSLCLLRVFKDFLHRTKDPMRNYYFLSVAI